MRPISRPKNAADFGAPEDPLRPAAVGDRPVHQPHAVREEQVLADEREMMLRLLGGEEAADDAAGHRQQRVAEPGAGVARVEQQLGLAPARVEERIAGDGAVAHEVAVEVRAHRRRERVELRRLVARGRRGSAPRRSGSSCWNSSATVQLDTIQSRMRGSAGCSESFQSPSP